MKGRLGNRLVASLEPRPKPYQVHDTDIHGFLLRVQPSGVMTYYYEYRLLGSRNRFRIEKHGKVTPEQARDRAKEIAADLIKGIDPKAVKREKVASLGKFIDGFYAPWAESHLRSGKTNVQRLKARFVYLLDKSLDDPKIPWLLEKWKTERLKGDVSKLTINRDLTVLKGAFAYAVKHREETGLQKNPLSEVKLFKVNDEESERTRYLNQHSSDEEERLFSALNAREKEIREGRESANRWRLERKYQQFTSLMHLDFVDHLKPMVLVSLHTGLRRGEIFNSRWTDINWKLDTPVLTVRGGIAKNGKSRSIPLNRTAADTLKKWMSQPQDLGGLIFPNQEGKAFDTIKTSWNNVIEKAKITDFRWHDLRHTFASRLVMRGVDLNTVRELLGHKDIKMTLRYSHLSPAVKAQAVAKLEASESFDQVEFSLAAPRGVDG